jgi:molecular chaperone GrpE
MENFRKRQQRRAEERVETERQRLLSAFLGIIDDLERAIASEDSDEAMLRQGLQLTHRSAQRLMEQEGAEQIKALDQAFDPAWHEAVATVGRNGSHVTSGTIVQVVEPGYRLRSQLLRPAKVIVAV